MQLTFSVKTPWPKKGEPDTGWIAEEVDSSDDRLTEIIAGSPFGHSLMVWEDGHRHASKLRLRTGIMIDIDNDSTYVQTPVTRRQIQEALKTLGCGYVMCPSKSHLREKPATAQKPAQAAVERWHIYLPFAEPTPSTPALEAGIENLIVKHFGPLGADPIFDGARYFGPGKSPELVTTFAAHPLQPQWIIGVYAGMKLGDAYRKEVAHKKREARGEAIVPGGNPARGRKGAEKGGEYWRKKQEVTLSDGRTVTADEIDTHTPCRCINPTHADEHASAFVAFNPDGYQFIHCKSCNLTWWEKDWMQPYLDKLFYAGSALCFMAGGDDIPWDHDLFPKEGIIAPTKEAKAGLIAMLAKNPMMRGQLKVDRRKGGLGPASATKDVRTSTLRMTEPMAKGTVCDNLAVESWFRNLFCQHADFLMNWVSIYAFADFQKLPVIVLNGPRGSGKSGFAEMLFDIYPTRSRRWDADDSGFNDELDSFLVHVDELPAAEHGRASNKAFYRQIKSLTGGKKIRINRKSGLRYDIRNNLNVIVTTNDKDPIHLNPFERATNVANNQFFIYTMPKPVEIDIPAWQHVQDAFAGWVRTAGHDRYQAWRESGEKDKTRYSLMVPITDEEESAYEESKSGSERLAPYLWIAMKDQRYNGVPLRTNPEKGFFTHQDFTSVSEAIGRIPSADFIRDTFRNYGWVESVSKPHRDGRAVSRGYAVTDEGRKFWETNNV